MTENINFCILVNILMVHNALIYRIKKLKYRQHKENQGQLDLIIISDIRKYNELWVYKEPFNDPFNHLKWVIHV
jgi:hypothetical protein